MPRTFYLIREALDDVQLQFRFTWLGAMLVGVLFIVFAPTRSVIQVSLIASIAGSLFVYCVYIAAAALRARLKRTR